MLCPVDGETLVMADRNGVEIDYCPKCRGVWLDRGELDKIIDRSASAPARAPAPAAPAAPAPVQLREPERPRADDRRDDDRRDERRDDRRYRDDDDDDHRYKRKRRDSFLSDLFDF